MKPLTRIEGRAARLLAPNIDTDQILPKQFLRTVDRAGLADALFFDQRFAPDGSERLEFELKRADQAETKVLFAGANFGCGSSREHAVWALIDYGIRCIIAPSFADIFANNAAGNGLLLITLPQPRVACLADEAPKGTFVIDLPSQLITAPSGICEIFEIDESAKEALIAGLDAIDATLLFEDIIGAFEKRMTAAARRSDAL